MDNDFDPKEYEKALEVDHENLSNQAIKILELGRDLAKDNIYQRRDYIKHITLIAVGLIALAPLIRDKVQITSYFNTGVVLVLITIVFALMRLREDLDGDANKLGRQMVERNIVDDLFELAEEYLKKEKTKENFLEWARKRTTEQNELYKNNDALNNKLDYFLELIIFIFVTGILLILCSISLSRPISIWALALMIVVVFLVVFFASTSKIFYPLNYIFNLGRAKNYKGIVIRESLDDERILKKYSTLRRELGGDGEWHVFTMLVTKSQIKSLASHIKDEKWYMHFWDSNENVIVVFKDKRFEFNNKNKAGWNLAIKHGVSLGIPEEQLDFPIN